MGYMHKRWIKYELVVWQVHVIGELSHLNRILASDIGSLSLCMLGTWHASNRGIQLRATISGVDVHRLAPGVSQGLENVPAQGYDRVPYFEAGDDVSDILFFGHHRGLEFCEGEVFCNIHSLSINFAFHSSIHPVEPARAFAINGETLEASIGSHSNEGSLYESARIASRMVLITASVSS